MHPWKARIVLTCTNGTVPKIQSCFYLSSQHCANSGSLLCVQLVSLLPPLGENIQMTSNSLPTAGGAMRIPVGIPVGWCENLAEELWGHRAFASLVNRVPPRCSPELPHSRAPAAQTPWPCDPSAPLQPHLQPPLSYVLATGCTHSFTGRDCFWRSASPTPLFYR